MSEVNPEAHNSEARLTKALRSMAASSASSAPPEIGATLAQAFRRHHARRRMVRRATMTAVALIIALPAVLLVSRKHVVESPVPALPGLVTAPNTAVAGPPARVFRTKSTALPAHTRRRTVAQRVASAAPHNDFLPLPSYDLRTQAEDLRIVRLRLNGRSLRLLGAPFSAEIDDRAVLADFVIGQDGTPYAVRLLQQNTR